MIGVVADDITGSNDIGIMFAKSNYTVHVYSYEENGFESNEPDVIVLDTDSRFDDATEAYQKVYQATKELEKRGAKQFINKTCSVFRGNIGPEFDAMLDALKEDFAVVVLGFPKNGRKTVNGIHYVHDQLLEESEFRHDPIHPMTDSNLVTILQSQTKRKVTIVNKGVVKKGAEEIRNVILSLKENYHYVIVDVTDQSDLRTIAEAVYDFKVLAGSSALAEELPAFIGERKNRDVPKSTPYFHQEKGLFCAAGSLMPQTAVQINYMKEHGASVLELNSLTLLETDQLDDRKDHLINEIVTSINKGRDVILHSSNDPSIVKETKVKALERGLSNREVSRLVSTTIAEITEAVIQQTGQQRFVIAGGDTSAAVCRRLGINGMRVWEEIQPGLPSCISLSNNPMLFVLKSGSFGKRNFFEQSFLHLRGQLLVPGGIYK
jgi:uncharacterized protein YgbK (DUF1537 family)